MSEAAQNRLAGGEARVETPSVASPEDEVARDEVSSRLSCPRCTDASPLEQEAEGCLRCPACSAVFPVFVCDGDPIPWLFERPEAAHLEWSSRYKGFLNSNAAEHNRLNRALTDTQLTDSGRWRIDEAMRAHREHRRQVADILMPLELYQDDLVPAITNLMQSKLPKNQALSSYANNVFRDWAWDNGESEASFAAVEEVLGQCDDIGSVLTLGAGACRLPYDIHRAYSPDLSVAMDINPLLLLIGSRVIRGKSVDLYEFPLTPRDPGRTGILQICRAPAAIPFGSSGDLRFVLGDASNVPFASGSFDTVVTPWLLDIVSIDLRDFVPHINRLLADDGLWINTGTLAFFSADPCRRYGEAEVREIVSENGFEIVAIDHRTIPYLQSPNASHGRYERIVSFAARKRRDTKPAVSKSRLPEWLINRTESIPLSTDLATASSEHLLIAQVLAAIDGRRSVVAIAALVSKQYGLELEECIHAVSRILADAHCDSGEVDPWT